MDPELREAGNLPAFDREALVASLEEMPALAEMGQLLALVALDNETGKVVGGGTLHHLDSQRAIVEIGYFVLPRRAGGVSRQRSRACSPSTRFRLGSSASPRM